jgi:hypothetical protein
MSKAGDWILREDAEALWHVLAVLEARGARYRFGAPLDARWMEGGWSSHFEFRTEMLRVRTDFVTRPPRLTAEQVSAMWEDLKGLAIPYVGAKELIELKKTNREKDYAVIGELARLLDDPADRLLLSRSARDIMALAEANPAMVRKLAASRPLLQSAAAGIAVLEAALDAERRALIHANEKRLQGFLSAAESWAGLWPEVEAEIANRPLRQAHEIVVSRAEGVLPVRVAGGGA